MRKFPGQGLSLSYSHDNANSLTCWCTRELQEFLPLVQPAHLNNHTHLVRLRYRWYGLQTNSNRIWGLIRNAISKPQPRPTKSEPALLTRWFICILDSMEPQSQPQDDGGQEASSALKQTWWGWGREQEFWQCWENGFILKPMSSFGRWEVSDYTGFLKFYRVWEAAL